LSARITVAIPTFNRARLLARAVASVQAQEYGPLEILIGDNASSDGTRELCEELAGRDPRVRYLRRPVNCGQLANFRLLLDEARGELFMWLADDDRLGPGFIRECASALGRLPDHVGVTGWTRYWLGDEAREEGRHVSLESDDPRSRVLEYYESVLRNELFASLVRREAALGCPLRDTVGADWHFVAALAFTGKLRTLESVHLERELGGTSDTFEGIVTASRLPAWYARVPYLVMAASAFSEILWRTRAYRRLGTLDRLRLAAKAAFIIAWRGRSHDFQALARIRARVAARLRGEARRGFS
jgi:glycosyltransferase involved in cell wall biosynthesis